MKDIQEYDGYKFEKGSVTKVTDPLSVESPLQISINNESFTVVMQTPGDEKSLACGLLYAENVIKDFSKVQWKFECNQFDTIEEVMITTPSDNLGDGFLSSRSLLSVSSCGICGKKEIEDLMPSEKAIHVDYQLEVSRIGQMMKSMRKNQKAFEITGGCHGIAAFDLTGNLLEIKEDIGRHNALDKVVGALLLSDRIKDAKIVTFSGRTSYEMVSKAFRAKIPFVISVSAPSSLAIDFAKEFGLTLIGFTRENKFTCYSHPNRLIEI